MSAPDIATEAAYRALPAVSWTRWIKPLILKSEAHAKFSIEHGGIDTSSRAFLNAVHCLSLRPDEFTTDFAVCTMRRDKRTKAYQAFLADAGDRLVITEKERTRAQHIADHVRAHPMMVAILARPDCRTEQSMVWRHPILGRCKGRADIVVPGVCTIDLKTYRSDEPKTVASDICKNAWHSQLGWYERCAAEHFDVDMSGAARITVIAVEHGGDYGPRDDVPGLVTVGWFEHSQAMRMVADAELDAALSTLTTCLEADTWAQPTPDEGVVVNPPRWAVEAAGLDPDDLFKTSIEVEWLDD